MFGQGLLKGLRITLGHFFEKKITCKYPEVKPNLPPRTRGSFTLNRAKCIACGVCANVCPNHVIKISSVKDENNKKKLTGYYMYLERCLFCGLCVESCPTKALKTTPEFELACFRREDCNLDLFAKGYDDPNEGKEEKKEADKPAAAEG